MTASSASLASLLSVAQASVNQRGDLASANAGFLRLLNFAQMPPVGTPVGHFFIQPDFPSLLNAPPDSDGLVHQGLLTVGEYALKTRTLRGRVWRTGECLHVLAEHDIEDLERLNATVLQLNQDYNRSQVELAQTNLQLQATNTRLKDTQHKLAEAEKMASLGVLVAGVAHEINTPLGVSLAAISDLQEKSSQLADSFARRSMTQTDLTRFLERCTESSALVNRNLERMARLIDSFRQVAVGARSSQRNSFALRQCLDTVVQSLGERLAACNVQMQIDCPAELAVMGNAEEWAVVFTNLIDNSLKHGFRMREQGRIGIHAAQDAHGLQLDYRDDGAGMAPDVLSRIFDPFFTTDLQNGMGLGMHLVYNLVTQRFGGHIRCESTPGDGMRIQIDIAA